MEKTNFENLRIYHLSEQVADLIWDITDNWDNFARSTVGHQIVRSADSIGANIAEGVGRWGIQDQKRFIYIARGSVNETKHWLRRAFKRNLLTAQQIDQLKPLIDELAPKLNAYAKSLDRSRQNAENKKQPSTIHDQPSTL